MVRELPKDFYFARPTKFGNGAKLKCYKKHIDKEMVIMTKEQWKKLKKKREISDKNFEKIEKEYAKKWQKTEDQHLDQDISRTL